MKSILRFLIVLPLPFIIAACFQFSSNKTPILYYTLSYPPPQVANLESLPVVIGMDRFNIMPPYSSRRMIYGTDAIRRDSYYYHRWQSDPADLATAFLRRDLVASDLFKVVTDPGSRLPVQYRVSGLVEEFFQKESTDGAQAVLTISVTLSDETSADISGRLRFQKTYHQSVATKGKHPRNLALAMSMAMAKVSQMIIPDIYSDIKKHIKSNP